MSLYQESTAFFPASDRPELRVPSVCLTGDLADPMLKRSNPADTAQEAVHQIMLREEVSLGVHATPARPGRLGRPPRHTDSESYE